jgi:hypothetical protein
MVIFVAPKAQRKLTSYSRSSLVYQLSLGRWLATVEKRSEEALLRLPVECVGMLMQVPFFLSYFVDIPFFISKIFYFYLDWTLLGT